MTIQVIWNTCHPLIQQYMTGILCLIVSFIIMHTIISWSKLGFNNYSAICIHIMIFLWYHFSVSFVLTKVMLLVLHFSGWSCPAATGNFVLSFHPTGTRTAKFNNLDRPVSIIQWPKPINDCIFQWRFYWPETNVSLA